jgi:hypothetical protein
MKTYELRKVTMIIRCEHDDEGYTHDSTNVAEVLLDVIRDNQPNQPYFDVRYIEVQKLDDTYCAAWSGAERDVRYINSESR